MQQYTDRATGNVSPSSRRAWIEIHLASRDDRFDAVALLAEGVDRNCADQHRFDHKGVALLAEGVDRNSSEEPYERWWGKSPSSRRAWIEIRW